MKIIRITPVREIEITVPMYSPFGTMDVVGKQLVPLTIYGDGEGVECARYENDQVPHLKGVEPFVITKQGLFPAQKKDWEMVNGAEPFVWIDDKTAFGLIHRTPLQAAAAAWVVPQKKESRTPSYFGTQVREGWAYRTYEGEGVGYSPYVKGWEYDNVCFAPVMGEITQKEVEELKQKISYSNDIVYEIELISEYSTQYLYGVIVKNNQI